MLRWSSAFQRCLGALEPESWLTAGQDATMRSALPRAHDAGDSPCLRHPPAVPLTRSLLSARRSRQRGAGALAKARLFDLRGPALRPFPGSPPGRLRGSEAAGPHSRAWATRLQRREFLVQLFEAPPPPVLALVRAASTRTGTGKGGSSSDAPSSGGPPQAECTAGPGGARVATGIAGVPGRGPRRVRSRPVSTRGGTRRVRLVRGEGRGVST